MRDLCITKVARCQKGDRRPLCDSEFYKYELKLRIQNPQATKWQCVLHIFVLPCSRGPLHGNPTIPCHASHPILSHGSHGCLLQVLYFLVLSEKSFQTKLLSSCCTNPSLLLSTYAPFELQHMIQPLQNLLQLTP